MIRKLKNILTRNIFRKRWRKYNKHNETRATSIFNLGSVTVGKNSYGNINFIQYDKSSTLKIGANVSIADETIFLGGGEHDYKRLSTWPYQSLTYHKKKNWANYETVIEDDVWIGYGSMVLTGVRIGKGSIIGARSVVAKDVPPFSVYVGNRVIKQRFSPKIIKELDKINFDDINHVSGDEYEKYCMTQLDEENYVEVIKAFTKNQ